MTRILSLQRKKAQYTKSEAEKEHSARDGQRHTTAEDKETNHLLNQLKRSFDSNKPFMVELILPVYARLNLLDQFFDILCHCTNSISAQMRRLSKVNNDGESSLIESLIIKDSFFDEKPFVFDYDTDPYILFRLKFVNTMKYLLSLLSVLNVACPHQTVVEQGQRKIRIIDKALKSLDESTILSDNQKSSLLELASKVLPSGSFDYLSTYQRVDYDEMFEQAKVGLLAEKFDLKEYLFEHMPLDKRDSLFSAVIDLIVQSLRDPTAIRSVFGWILRSKK